MTHNVYKAAVLEKQNDNLELQQYNILRREPVGFEVEVEMITSGLCGAQTNEITGKKGVDRFLPHFMGHEGFGRVIRVGDGVTKVRQNDFVILHWRPGSGGSFAGMSCVSDTGLKIGGGPVTTFSELTYVSENRCTKIIPNPKLNYVYPLLGCALSTSHGAIHKESKVTEGQSVLIIGLGGLGTALSFWLSMIKDLEIWAFDIHPEKTRFTEEFSISFVSDPLSLAAEKKFDHVFETSGVIENVELAFDSVGKQGTINLIGQVPHSTPVVLKNFLKMYDGVKILSSSGGLFNPDDDLSYLHNLLLDNIEKSARLVSSVIGIDQINEGFRAMKAPDTRRVIIDFQRGE